MIDLLKKFKREIGWTIVGIRGVSPFLCMHKIILEDGERDIIDGQRMLNSITKEVVKIGDYQVVERGNHLPISDSSCMNPVQCMSKKGGVTIVKNENNEPILT